MSSRFRLSIPLLWVNHELSYVSKWRLNKQARRVNDNNKLLLVTKAGSRGERYLIGTSCKLCDNANPQSLYQHTYIGSCLPLLWFPLWIESLFISTYLYIPPEAGSGGPEINVTRMPGVTLTLVLYHDRRIVLLRAGLCSNIQLNPSRLKGNYRQEEA